MSVCRCVRRDLVADVGCTDDCTDENGTVCSAGAAAGGTTASGSVDGFASALAGVVPLLGKASGLSHGVNG